MNNAPARSVWLLWTLSLVTAPAFAGDEDRLRLMLDEFLDGVATLEAHQRFWADDLVYTSSNGTRMGKAAILDGMRESAGAESGNEAPTYSAEDVDVRVYGDTAVIAFKLLAHEPGVNGGTSRYLNTGTFLKRNGVWQVVAWQATRIPD